MVGGDCCVPNPFDTFIGVALQKERKLQGSDSARTVWLLEAYCKCYFDSG